MIKWIGQHIWDFVSRFRNDVYLENIADGTVDSDKFLGLDSNNKIVKEAVSSGVSLGNDGNDRVVTATGGGALNGEANLTWNNIQLGLEYAGSSGPTMLLTKTSDDASAPIINFVAQRAANGGAANNDNDVLGYTNYWGYNNASTPEAITFAQVYAQISERDDGVEEGKLCLLVQAQGALREGLELTANGANVIDANIGFGNTSLTTIGGNAFIKSNIQLGNALDTTIARSAAGKVTIQGNQIVTAGAVGIASGSQAPIGMQIARRTITQAEANAMNSTPIELIPAQGANTIIEISSVIARVDRAATQTNSAVDMNLHYADKEPGTYGAASIAHFRRFMHNKTTDAIERRVISQATSGVTLTEDVNKAVEVSFDAATTTNCFTSIDMYVTYFVIDIS